MWSVTCVLLGVGTAVPECLSSAARPVAIPHSLATARSGAVHYYLLLLRALPHSPLLFAFLRQSRHVSSSPYIAAAFRHNRLPFCPPDHQLLVRLLFRHYWSLAVSIPANCVIAGLAATLAVALALAFHFPHVVYRPPPELRVTVYGNTVPVGAIQGALSISGVEGEVQTNATAGARIPVNISANMGLLLDPRRNWNRC